MDQVLIRPACVIRTADGGVGDETIESTARKRPVYMHVVFSLVVAAASVLEALRLITLQFVSSDEQSLSR
jgi:hypothetical protein